MAVRYCPDNRWGTALLTPTDVFGYVCICAALSLTSVVVTQMGSHSMRTSTFRRRGTVLL